MYPAFRQSFKSVTELNLYGNKSRPRCIIYFWHHHILTCKLKVVHNTILLQTEKFKIFIHILKGILIKCNCLVVSVFCQMLKKKKYPTALFGWSTCISIINSNKSYAMAFVYSFSQIKFMFKTFTLKLTKCVY